MCTLSQMSEGFDAVSPDEMLPPAAASLATPPTKHRLRRVGTWTSPGGLRSNPLAASNPLAGLKQPTKDTISSPGAKSVDGGGHRPIHLPFSVNLTPQHDQHGVPDDGHDRCDQWVSETSRLEGDITPIPQRHCDSRPESQVTDMSLHRAPTGTTSPNGPTPQGAPLTLITMTMTLLYIFFKNNVSQKMREKTTNPPERIYEEPAAYFGCL